MVLVAVVVVVVEKGCVEEGLSVRVVVSVGFLRWHMRGFWRRVWRGRIRRTVIVVVLYVATVVLLLMGWRLRGESRQS